MYRPTLAIDAIGLDDPDAIEMAMANMGDVLMALVSIDRRYIRKDHARVEAGYSSQIPLLYESGCRYDRLEPAPGSACGDDDWQDIVTVLEHPEHPMLLDCEDAACWRVAELIERFHVPDAVPFVRLHADRVRDVTDGQLKPRHLYHIMVRWPEGLSDYPTTVYRDDPPPIGSGALLEDPSKVLGMTGDG
jgi:hypothetical protein